jgi:hypothetical protein
MKYGIKIETFESAGRYQHKVQEIGIKSDRVGEISNDIVEAQKKVNEKLWEELPQGASNLVSIIRYAF